MRYPSRKPIRIGTDYLPALLECDLSRKQQGELLQMMLEYLFLDKEPEKLDPELRACWAFVHWDLDHEKRRKEERENRDK